MSETQELEGKVVLISGASRGQGEAGARLMASRGAKVVLADVLDVDGERVAADIGDDALYSHLDVRSVGDWESTTASAIERFGRLDVLVNNAGICLVGSIEEMPRDDYMSVVEINQLGCFLGMQAAIPHLRRSGGGSIVNISSTAGIEGVAGVSAYVASKFAIRGMTKAAAIELGHDGIRVNAVHPGTIDTPMVSNPDFDSVDKDSVFAALPIPRIGSPEEVAEMVAFLASDRSSYCTGGEFLVDGGAMAGGPKDIQ